MRKVGRSSLTIALAAAAGMLLLSGAGGRAQDKPGREFFQANAMGQSTQLGKQFSVNIIIDEYSTEEERQGLIEAFKSGKSNRDKSKNLVNALEKMHAKGRVAITGTLGYDIAYAKSFPTETGRKIRIITNRLLRIGEVWASTRTTDYDLTAIEINITNDGKHTGVLLPACRFRLDKSKQLEIENYQNPWKLTNIRDRSD